MIEKAGIQVPACHADIPAWSSVASDLESIVVLLHVARLEDTKKSF